MNEHNQNNAQVHILLVESKGEIKQANQSWYQATGFTKEEVLGKNFHEFLSTNAVNSISELSLTELAQNGWPAGTPCQIITKDGRCETVQFNAALTSPNGKAAMGTVVLIPKQRKDVVSLQEQVDKALQKISQSLLSTKLSFDEIAKLTLKYAKNITGAEHGFVSTIDPITKDNVAHTLTDMLGKSCLLTGEYQKYVFPPDKTGKYPGLWGYALNTKTGFFTNEPTSFPAFSNALPEGHIKIKNFLSIPALIGENLVGQISLANAKQNFTSAHQNAIQQLADIFSLAIERHRLAQIEAENQAMYRSLVENTSVIPWSYSLISKSFTYIGPQVTDILGYPPESWQGFSSWAERVHPEDREWTINYCTVNTQKGLDHAFEYRMVTADGKVVWFRDVTAVIKENGKPVNTVGFFFDITNLKETEQKLAGFNQELEQKVQARTRQLKAANKDLESFSYSVAHDLRAPLRAMRGFSEILLEDYQNALDETGMIYLMRILNASENMDNLINDLLDFSRLGRRKLDLQEVDLNQAARNVYRMLVNEDLSTAIYFSTDFENSVCADITLIEQLFSNLIENAIKYSMPKDKIQITAGSTRMNGENVYYVKDNGIGFSMKYAEKIFSPFQRLHSDEEFSGSGIGLAIVKRVVNLHKGRVWAESEPGEGTVIYFTLEPDKVTVPQISKALPDKSPNI